MDNLIQDLRYGIRTLLKRPGFTIVAALSLALGIGANTAIFTLVDKTLIRPLPVDEPEKLVNMARYFKQTDVFDYYSSYPAFSEIRERNGVFEEFACYAVRPLSLSESGQSERLQGMIVSGNYFKALRVTPALGRGFIPEEDQSPGTHQVAVLSYGLWQRRFGADPNVINRTVSLNGHAFTITGVAPAEFTGTHRGFAPDIYVPMMTIGQAVPSLGDKTLSDTGFKWLMSFGRLKPGVSREQAEAAIHILGVSLEQAEADQFNRERGIASNPNAVWPQYVLQDGSQGHTTLLKDISFPLRMLMAIVGLVLLIACANVANMLLARATARHKEIAIRLAVGASRARLIRQLLTESLLLALLGGAAGLILADLTGGLLSFFTPPGDSIPLSLDGSLDSRVLLFTLALSLLTGLIFGLVPALGASRPNLTAALKNEAPLSQSFRRLSVRNLLVIAQVSLSFMVLIGAGLCVRSLQNLQAIDAGFDPARVLVMSTDLSLSGYNQATGQEFNNRLIERVKTLPGVESASLAMATMLGERSFNWTARIEGHEPHPGDTMTFRYNIVGPNYFQTMKIPLLRGRDFNEQDTAAGPLTIIINETLANRYWPGEDPLGKRITLSGKSREVIGIVKDSRYANLTEEIKRTMYLPVTQNYRPALTLHIRTAADPKAMVAAVRRQVQEMDAGMPVFDIKTLEEQKSRSLYTANMAASLLSVFGFLALLLAAVGLYGVMAYAVNSRTREIGIRMALGARTADVLRLVIGEGTLLVILGIAIGLGGAIAATRLVSSFLYGVSATDPITFAVVAVLLIAVTLMACYLPARRAARVDPMEALRYE